MNRININRIRLYNNIKNDQIIIKAVDFLNNLQKDTNNIDDLEDGYFSLQNHLLEKFSHEAYGETLWQGYITKLMANCQNNFTLGCEKAMVSEGIENIAILDLDIIKKMYHVNWKEIGNQFKDTMPAFLLRGNNNKRKKLHDGLSKNTIAETLADIKAYYNNNGCGLFEEYEAFRWKDGLVGIPTYDSITFDDLKGYDTQKKSLIENTKFLIDGLKSNNVLLYGDRGTGKSSSVKALLNKYKNEKLKIIEVSKEQFFEFGRILDIVKHRGHKFLIFIDDLSFDDFEMEYKHFKAVLEGGLEVRPSNVAIYVTTNRRHLIKESWKDQAGAQGDEIHISDSVQEKLSLADRFGLTITYPSPDKALFLDIVKQKTLEAGICIEEEKLFEEALIWEMRNHGKSGRSATQFTDYIISQYQESKSKGE